MGTRGEQAADERGEDRNPGVAPVAVALARHWQQSVGEARAKVASGIDGIAGGASQRKADRKDEQRHGQRAEGAQTDDQFACRLGKEREFYLGVGHQENRQDQEKSANDLTKKRLWEIADIWARGKTGKLCISI